MTDVHSSSAVCTPSRYSVLTGRYCWRTRLQRWVLWGFEPPLIEEQPHDRGFDAQTGGLRHWGPLASGT